MPSLVDFNPLLQTYKPDAGAEEISRGAREAFGYAAEAIEKTGERGRQREKEFKSVFDVDVSKIADMESKRYAINKYNQLKNEYIKRFQSKKDWLGYGKLPPEQQIELRGDLDSLKSEIETMKVADKALIGANEKYGVGQGGVFEFDREFADEYSNAKISGNPDDLARVLQKFGRSETGQPFVRFQDENPDNVIVGTYDAVKDKLPEIKETEIRQYESGGNVVTKTDIVTKFGDERLAKDYTYNIIAGKKDGKAEQTEWNLRRVLSDEEKLFASDKYGGKVQYPLLKYYVEEKATITPSYATETDTKKATKLISGTARKESKVIEPTERGWKYGANRVLYDGELEIDGEMQTVVGARNVGIIKKDDGLYAEFIVPRDPEEEFLKSEDLKEKEIQKRIDAETGGLRRRARKEKVSQIKKETEAKYGIDFHDESKKKTVLVPLESVYDELISNFRNKNIVIKGLEEAYGESLKGNAPEAEQKSEGFYNLNGSEYTKQELLDAGWTEEDLKKL